MREYNPRSPMPMTVVRADALGRPPAALSRASSRGWTDEGVRPHESANNCRFSSSVFGVTANFVCAQLSARIASMSPLIPSKS